MKKEEYIKKYGVEKWLEYIAYQRDYYTKNIEKVREKNREYQREYQRKYYAENKEKVKERCREHIREYQHKYYADIEIRGRVHEYMKKYCGSLSDHNSIPYRKSLIRQRDHHRFFSIKQFFQNLQTDIHHEWIPNTADYTFIALVERDKHRYNIIDPIVILEKKVVLRELL